MNEYDTSVDPGMIVEKLNEFNADFKNSELKIEVNLDKQWVKIIKEDKEQNNTLIVKMKCFDIGEPAEGEDKRYRVKFTKKRGNLMDWYELLGDMKECTFSVEG